MDSLAWVLALLTATVLRYEFALRSVSWGGLVFLVALAVVVQLIAGVVAGLYVGRWRYGSFEEVAALVPTVVITTLVVVIDLLMPGWGIPSGATLAGGVIALVEMAGTRYGWRLALERQMRPSGEATKRAVVFGAGEGGEQIITAMLRNPASPYLPLALLDDDPAKRKLRIKGVPVAGDRTAIDRVAHAFEAEALVIAIPSAPAGLIRDLSELAPAEVAVLVLPHVHDLLGSRPQVSDIRPIAVEDLLGRHELDTDVKQIAGYITDRRVLVTGAGGSIGSELCRQLSAFEPAALVMLDHDESALHAVQMSILGRPALESPNLVVADIRDRQRLEEVFAHHAPEVVFHAAALKHVGLLERQPREAVKTNVLATNALLEVSLAHGVGRFVNVSTDTAPTVLRRRLDALVTEHPDADPHEAAAALRRLLDALDLPTSPPAHATARDLVSAAARLDRF